MYFRKSHSRHRFVKSSASLVPCFDVAADGPTFDSEDIQLLEMREP